MEAAYSLFHAFQLFTQHSSTNQDSIPSI